MRYLGIIFVILLAQIHLFSVPLVLAAEQTFQCTDTKPDCTGRGCSTDRYDCAAAEASCAALNGTGVKAGGDIRCTYPDQTNDDEGDGVDEETPIVTSGQGPNGLNCPAGQVPTQVEFGSCGRGVNTCRFECQPAALAQTTNTPRGPATYLVGIPGIAEGQDYTLTAVVNALYLVAISIAGLLAVVKIVLAGAKYMLTDIVSTKQDARNDIQGALFGLLLILASALILYTINPNLARLELQAPPLAPLPRAASVTAMDTLTPFLSALPTGTRLVGQGTCTTAAACDSQARRCENLLLGSATQLNDEHGNEYIVCTASTRPSSNVQLACEGATCRCASPDGSQHGACISECQSRPGYVSHTPRPDVVWCYYQTDSSPGTQGSSENDSGGGGEVVDLGAGDVDDLACDYEQPITSCLTSNLLTCATRPNPANVCQQRLEGAYTVYYGYATGGDAPAEIPFPNDSLTYIPNGTRDLGFSLDAVTKGYSFDTATPDPTCALARQVNISYSPSDNFVTITPRTSREEIVDGTCTVVYESADGRWTHTLDFRGFPGELVVAESQRFTNFYLGAQTINLSQITGNSFPYDSATPDPSCASDRLADITYSPITNLVTIVPIAGEDSIAVGECDVVFEREAERMTLTINLYR